MGNSVTLRSPEEDERYTKLFNDPNHIAAFYREIYRTTTSEGDKQLRNNITLAELMLYFTERAKLEDFFERMVEDPRIIKVAYRFCIEGSSGSKLGSWDEDDHGTRIFRQRSVRPGKTPRAQSARKRPSSSRASSSRTLQKENSSQFFFGGALAEAGSSRPTSARPRSSKRPSSKGDSSQFFFGAVAESPSNSSKGLPTPNHSSKGKREIDQIVTPEQFAALLHLIHSFADIWEIFVKADSRIVNSTISHPEYTAAYKILQNDSLINFDGVTKKEWEAEFKAIDHNGNGYINYYELCHYAYYKLILPEDADPDEPFYVTYNESKRPPEEELEIELPLPLEADAYRYRKPKGEDAEDGRRRKKKVYVPVVEPDLVLPLPLEAVAFRCRKPKGEDAEVGRRRKKKVYVPIVEPDLVLPLPLEADAYRYRKLKGEDAEVGRRRNKKVNGQVVEPYIVLPLPLEVDAFRYRKPKGEDGEDGRRRRKGESLSKQPCSCCSCCGNSSAPIFPENKDETDSSKSSKRFNVAKCACTGLKYVGIGAAAVVAGAVLLPLVPIIGACAAGGACCGSDVVENSTDKVEELDVLREKEEKQALEREEGYEKQLKEHKEQWDIIERNRIEEARKRHAETIRTMQELILRRKELWRKRKTELEHQWFKAQQAELAKQEKIIKTRKEKWQQLIIVEKERRERVKKRLLVAKKKAKTKSDTKWVEKEKDKKKSISEKAKKDYKKTVSERKTVTEKERKRIETLNEKKKDAAHRAKLELLRLQRPSLSCAFPCSCCKVPAMHALEKSLKVARKKYDFSIGRLRRQEREAIAAKEACEKRCHERSERAKILLQKETAAVTAAEKQLQLAEQALQDKQNEMDREEKDRMATIAELEAIVQAAEQLIELPPLPEANISEEEAIIAAALAARQREHDDELMIRNDPDLPVIWSEQVPILLEHTKADREAIATEKAKFSVEELEAEEKYRQLLVETFLCGDTLKNNSSLLIPTNVAGQSEAGNSTGATAFRTDTAGALVIGSENTKKGAISDGSAAVQVPTNESTKSDLMGRVSTDTCTELTVFQFCNTVASLTADTSSNANAVSGAVESNAIQQSNSDHQAAVNKSAESGDESGRKVEPEVTGPPDDALGAVGVTGDVNAAASGDPINAATDDISESEMERRVAEEAIEARIQQLRAELEAQLQHLLRDPIEVHLQEQLAAAAVKAYREKVQADKRRKDAELQASIELQRQQEAEKLARQQAAEAALMKRKLEWERLQEERAAAARAEKEAAELAEIQRIKKALAEERAREIQEAREAAARAALEEEQRLTEELTKIEVEEEEWVEKRIIEEVRTLRQHVLEEITKIFTIEEPIDLIDSTKIIEEIQAAEAEIVKETMELVRVEYEASVRELKERQVIEFEEECVAMATAARQRGERVVSTKIESVLKERAVCPNNYYWLKRSKKEGGGYVCAGGAHSLTDQEMGKMPSDSVRWIPISTSSAKKKQKYAVTSAGSSRVAVEGDDGEGDENVKDTLLERLVTNTVEYEARLKMETDMAIPLADDLPGASDDDIEEWPAPVSYDEPFDERWISSAEAARTKGPEAAGGTVVDDSVGKRLRWLRRCPQGYCWLQREDKSSAIVRTMHRVTSNVGEGIHQSDEESAHPDLEQEQEGGTEFMYVCAAGTHMVSAFEYQELCTPSLLLENSSE